MKWWREFLLCISVGIITLILFILAGIFYIANEHSILTNTIVWLILNLLAYISMIFIPFFQKKTVRYIDLWAFASGLFAIMLYCLSQAKSIEDYSYLSVLSYIAGILSLGELLLSNQRKVESAFIQNNTNAEVLKKISDLPIDIQQDIKKLIAEYDKDTFKLKNAANLLKKSEYRTRKIIKLVVERSIVIEKGNTSAKQYQIAIRDHENE